MPEEDPRSPEEIAAEFRGIHPHPAHPRIARVGSLPTQLFLGIAPDDLSDQELSALAREQIGGTLIVETAAE